MTTLEDIDFAQAWREMDAKRNAPDDASYWDGRAKEFSTHVGRSSYNVKFIELMDIQPGESVFDMGCGSGAIALPLARQGHPAAAVDFSGKMLEALMAGAEHDGTTQLITPIQASWEDDWDAAGVPVCDLAIASRSIMVADLEAALKKFMAHARRRCCLTLPTRESPRYDKVLWDAVGRTASNGNGSLYCLGILQALGYEPEMRKIVTTKYTGFETREGAVENARKALRDMTPEEELLFDAWCDEHIVQTTDPEGNPCWVRNYECYTHWAFISWDL